MLGISFLDRYNYKVLCCSIDRKILALFGTAKNSFVFESKNMNF